MMNISLQTHFSTRAQKILSAKDALVLHDAFADDPVLGFRDITDGCYARAHLMCREMERLGLKPFKIMAFRDYDAEEGHLSPRVMNTEYEKKVTGDFHITAATDVEISPGVVKTMIFDPLLFDGPVTQEDWARTIKARNYMIQLLPFGEKPQGYEGDYHPLRGLQTDAGTDAHAREALDQLAAEDPLPLQRVVLPSPLRAEMMARGDADVPSLGATWIPKTILAAPEVTQDLRPPSVKQQISGFFKKIFAPGT